VEGEIRAAARGELGRLTLGQPGLEVLGHEVVVVQLDMRAIHPRDLIGLARREGFLAVQRQNVFKQALTTQHLVNSRDAARETVGWIEDRPVRIGERGAEPKQVGRLGRIVAE
jgi:hypothetical protein